MIKKFNNAFKKVLGVRLFKAVLIVSIAVILVKVAVDRYKIVKNYSESLPIHYVLIKKGKLPTKHDQIFVFKVKDNPFYKAKEVNFLKLVGGLSGDEIEVNGGEVFFDGKKIPSVGPLSDVFETLTLAKITNPEDLKKRKVTFVEREIYVSGKKIGIIKPFTRKYENFVKKQYSVSPPDNTLKFDDKNYELHPIETGKIPAHKFFAYTPHRDSFDSRYKEIGLIDEKDIIGTAIFAF